MKRFAGVIIFLLFFISATAHHIIGGEMYYTFVKKTDNNYQYEITLKLYRGCEPQDENHSLLDPYVTFSIFNKDDHSFVDSVVRIPLDGPHEIRKQRENPCIVNAPEVCYQVGYYRATVSFPVNKKGYTIAYQRCCRNDLLRNANTSGFVGATYFTDIPGSENGIPGDSGPRHEKEEAVLLCSKGNVNYNFQETDPDGDELRYAFAPGYVGGNAIRLAPVPTSPPPFQNFSYKNGFTGYTPLGEGVTIDSLTGKIYGRTDLTPGVYDITIRVRAYRDGKLIATNYRDFQFEIHDCHRLALADIPPFYNECKSNTFHFTNNSTPGKPYLWDFGDGSTSTEAEPTHTFREPGTYHVWIKVDPTSPCGDSMQSTVKVFPGLKSTFKKQGSCLQFPVAFIDESSTPLGNIVSRHWDFGDPATLADTSDEKDPAYHYTAEGTFPVTLKVTTDSGCVQTDTQTFRFYDKPPLTVTSDTIMCSKDPFHLMASSSLAGHFKWGPDYRINDQNIADPTVQPLQDTTYKVVFTDDQGCVNTDSVHLKVMKKIIVNAGNDTIICKGDPVSLQAAGDENYTFTWYNTENEVVANGKDATFPTSQNEIYRVRATLGTCSAEDEMAVKTVPYPIPVIHPADTAICYGDTISLTGEGGAFYKWSPSDGLSNNSQSTVLADPKSTGIYTLTVIDTLGCPKPVDTSMRLRVVPPVQAFAGNDTIITTGQSFQLHASGGNRYRWTPSMGLSDPDIADPVVNGTKDIVYKLTVMVQPQGCVGYDSLSIRYVKGPEVYVPSAFTPNGDGRNDVFRPIPVGITQIAYFRVYNRWGALVYKTKAYMKGWDGNYKGRPAQTGAYVWMLKARDFEGHTILKKGTVMLIR